jgi:hypothetical protein
MFQNGTSSSLEYKYNYHIPLTAINRNLSPLLRRTLLLIQMSFLGEG